MIDQTAHLFHNLPAFIEPHDIARRFSSYPPNNIQGFVPPVGCDKGLDDVGEQAPNDLLAVGQRRAAPRYIVDFIIFCVVSAQTPFNNLIDFIYKKHSLFKPFAHLFRLDLHEIPVIALLSEVIHARE